MSVLFLPPSAGAASVPDATETVSGKIRIATSAEATAGTLDTAAMTPLKVKSVVDSAIVGGVTYQGTFDTSSPDDLSNAEKGDLYIISVAGSYQGITWAVGDHLLVNADMGGTISPSKIDKVDNTDAVTSVAGKIGIVTLDLDDLEDVTITSAAAGESIVYNGTLSKFENATISGGVTTLGALTDVTIAGVSAGDTIIYNGTLSVFKNSTLATVATTGAYGDLSGTPTNVSAFSNDAGYLTSVPVDSVASKTGTVTLDLDDLEDVTITSAAAGESIVYNGTLSKFENATISGGVTTLGALTDVTITSVSARDTIIYNGTLSVFENSTLATVASTGAYSDLSGTPTNVSAFSNDAGYLTSVPVDSVAGKTGTVTLDLDDLEDVTISTPSAGESIVYNGTLSAFQNATISGGGGGGSTLPTVTTQTGSYTIPSRTAGQLNLVVLVNNGASAVTINLPSIASGDVGFMIDIKVLGTGTVTVDAGSNYIDDGAAHTLNITTQYDSRTFVAGTTADWYII